MSAPQSTEYHTSASRAYPLTHINLYDPRGLFVDRFRTRSGADYACRLLNEGHARINPHACIGCRVEISR